LENENLSLRKNCSCGAAQNIFHRWIADGWWNVENQCPSSTITNHNHYFLH
jgi:uncharacterized membrane protein